MESEIQACCQKYFGRSSFIVINNDIRLHNGKRTDTVGINLLKQQNE